MDMNEALQNFLAESRELIADMELALLAVEQTEQKDDALNAVFRAAHTIKGSAGLFGLNDIVSFTHVLESVLDHVRAGDLRIDDDMVGLLLACCDHMGALIDGATRGQIHATEALQAAAEPLLARLRPYLVCTSGAHQPKAEAEAIAASHAAAPVHTADSVAEPGVAADHWHISVRFGMEVLRNGMDPLAFIRYMATFGSIRGIVTVTDGLPGLEDLDPELCYLGFEIAFKTDADKARIEKVFEFVRDDCDLRILPPHSLNSAYVQLIAQQSLEPSRLGDMLVGCGTLTEQELQLALKSQESEPTKAVGDILVEQGAVHPDVVRAALNKQQVVKDNAAQERRSIRIDAEKLDHLINLVGELIIAGAGVNLIAHKAQNVELQASTSKLSVLVQEVRDSALQLRMVKIGTTFARFQRVVRDVSHELGKEIQLLCSGEDTELDKTVIEKINDPLTHMVRNAMDHGIEPTDVRAARGKPPKGTVRLNAYHESGIIAITVEDDGGGLKRDIILAKAIERGLVEPGQQLSDGDIYGLIFEPGFSTAEAVTNLSGRGVGLDVVKRNITALRGTVSVESQPGVGTKVTVRLPLTLAIIDGFLVSVGRAVYAIPLDMVEECIAFDAEPGRDYTNLRGQVLPFIRLRELFGVQGPPPKGENIVVLKAGNLKAGLVVDSLLGEFQTVIKPLGEVFANVKCISGSTILGSGEVALILDVMELVKHCVQREPKTPAFVSLQAEAMPA